MNKIRKAELITRVSKDLKDLSDKQIKQVIERFLSVIEQSLINAEDIAIKNHFTLKRRKQSRLKTGKEKFCDEHSQLVENHKRDTVCCGTAGARKTVAEYAKCKQFRELRNKIRSCSNCQTKREAVEKSRAV